MATDRDGILARLDRLEAENASLRREVQRMRFGELTAASEAAAGSATLADDTAAAPPPAAADAVSRRQVLRRAGITAIGAGVVVASAATLSRAEPVRAGSDSAILIGQLNDTADDTTYLTNELNNNSVFFATSDGAGTGLTGSSRTGVGVAGIGSRGAAFIGIKAAINLSRTPGDGHPHKGMVGDIVLDRSARLWLCKGGTKWKQLG